MLMMAVLELKRLRLDKHEQNILYKYASSLYACVRESILCLEHYSYTIRARLQIEDKISHTKSIKFNSP